VGGGDECPYGDDWLLENPTGSSMAAVRRVRDEIHDRVRALVEMHGWSGATSWS
jgi:hypothetical protein